MDRLVLLTPALLCLCYILQMAAAAEEGHNGHFVLRAAQSQEDTRAAFDAWAVHNGKAYASQQEFTKRLGVWTANVQRQLARTNAAEVAVNGLADLTTDEFRAAYLGYVPRSTAAVELSAGKHKKEPFRYENVTLPKHVDWRLRDIVGPIKDQHVGGSPCGCCWAFATIGVTECIVGMSLGQPISLSEQQLIDCDHGAPWYDLGCDGGDFEGGVDYIVENGGITTEAEYPYLAHDDKCIWRKEDAHPRAATLDGFADVPPDNDTALAQAVSQHPVAVAVCCGDLIDAWHQYSGGMFDIPEKFGGCSDPLDHAVVVVGFGTTEDGQDYWLVKNSWGVRWGEQGFFRTPRNIGKPLGAWGLLTQPGYPIKVGVNSKEDPIRTDIWDLPAPGLAAAATS